MIKYFTIEDLLKHYLQKKFHILHCPLDGEQFMNMVSPFFC